jgi:hypothetical protein
VQTPCQLLNVSKRVKNGANGKQRGTFMAMTDNFRHMVLTVLVVCLAPAAAAHPLQDAAYQAMTLCTRMEGIETLDQCGATISPSPDRPAAKAALQRMFKARIAFMAQCDTGRGMLERCQEQADLYVWAGAMRDFKWTVQHLDRPPQPSERR